ncbi:MAG: hypothetical protein ABIF10_06030, partial [Candidatus Woesearchaeota archaeon]
MKKKRKPYLFFAILAAVALVFLFFGAKIFLFLNQFLGNDIIIRLAASDNTVSAYRLEEKKVSFTAGVRSNPFCKTECSSVFESLDKGVIDRSVFVLRPGGSVTKDYFVSEDRLGSGYALYRFKTECRGIPNFLCHTSGNPTERAVLVRLNYNLTPEELAARDESLELMSDAVHLVESALTSYRESGMLLEILPVSKIQVENVSVLARNVTSMLRSAENICDSEDYLSLLPVAKNVFLEAEMFQGLVNGFSTDVEEFASMYNHVGKMLLEVGSEIDSLVSSSLSYDDSLLLTKYVLDYNLLVEGFSVDKLQAISNLQVSVEGLKVLFEERALDANLARAVSLAVRQHVWCNVSGICIEYPNILNLS